MLLRDRLQTALKEAMKAKEADRLSTLRLINAAIKDREIALRGEGEAGEVGEAEILQIMGKMVKQRQESAKAFTDGNRPELAATENAEIAIISDFLPQQMDEAAVEAAIREAIAATGAASIKDMGKVVGQLKAKYAGQIDFSKASAAVKKALGG